LEATALLIAKGSNLTVGSTFLRRRKKERVQRKTRAADPKPAPTIGPTPNKFPELEESATRVLLDGAAHGEGAGVGGAIGAFGFFP
jgi:hypothetical protein